MKLGIIANTKVGASVTVPGAGLLLQNPQGTTGLRLGAPTSFGGVPAGEGDGLRLINPKTASGYMLGSPILLVDYPVPVAPPTITDVISPSSSTLQVYWNDNQASPADSFNIKVSKSGIEEQDIGVGAVSSHVVSGLLADTEYSIVMTATVGAAVSGLSNTRLATTAVETGPPVGIHYFDGFEDGSLNIGVSSPNGFYWIANNGWSTVNSVQPKTGAFSLEMFYNGNADPAAHARTEQRFNIGNEFDSIWVQYDIYIPSNYNHENRENTNNNKAFLHLWGPSDAAYGDVFARDCPLLGPNFWPSSGGQSHIAMWAGARVDGVKTLDKHWNTATEPEGGGLCIKTEDFGTWIKIKIHATTATVANNDGVYELWKTNASAVTEKLINIQDGPWFARSVDGLSVGGFQNGYLLGEANSGFAVDTKLYIDNFAIAADEASLP